MLCLLCYVRDSCLPPGALIMGHFVLCFAASDTSRLSFSSAVTGLVGKTLFQEKTYDVAIPGSRSPVRPSPPICNLCANAGSPLVKISAVFLEPYAVDPWSAGDKYRNASFVQLSLLIWHAWSRLGCQYM